MGLKEAYQEKLEAQLKSWSADIEKMKAQAANAKADLKVEYEKQLADLHAKHGDAQSKLDEIKNSGVAAWEELKTSSEMAFDQLRQTIKNTSAKFK